MILKGRTKFVFLALIFALAVFCKYLQFNYLSFKYFIDSNKILAMIANPDIIRGESYVFTADFFRFFNIFLNFNTLKQWSYFITIVFNILIFLILNKYSKFSFDEMLFIYMSMTLLDIFAFNLSKEVIQLAIFWLLFVILINKKMKIKSKIIWINVVLLLESLFFREYYILMLLGFDICYVIFNKFDFTFKRNRLKAIIISIMIFLTALGISKFILPNYYNMLIDVRMQNFYTLENTNTVIQNIVINDGTFLTYAANYIINFIRIVCPIELFFRGIKYLPFIIYQLILVFHIFINMDKNYKLKKIIMAIIAGYFFTSVCFEPDFGSIVRHESVMLLIFILLKKADEVYNPSEENKHVLIS